MERDRPYAILFVVHFTSESREKELNPVITICFNATPHL